MHTQDQTANKDKSFNVGGVVSKEWILQATAKEGQESQFDQQVPAYLAVGLAVYKYTEYYLLVQGKARQGQGSEHGDRVPL